MLIGSSLSLSVGSSKVYYINITTSVNNWGLLTALIAQGWNSSSNNPVYAVITISSGVVVGSAAPTSNAMNFGIVPPGSRISLINNGMIVGAGGVGGAASRAAIYAGGNGGNALRLTGLCTITNNGTLAGGGGGGGGGNYVDSSTYSFNSGGGGGAGVVPGAGGVASGGNTNVSGVSGTTSAGGAGGDAYSGYSGGNGGNLGMAGGLGTTSGGTAGTYIIGNANATWLVTGTRLGGFT